MQRPVALLSKAAQTNVRMESLHIGDHCLQRVDARGQSSSSEKPAGADLAWQTLPCHEVLEEKRGQKLCGSHLLNRLTANSESREGLAFAPFVHRLSSRNIRRGRTLLTEMYEAEDCPIYVFRLKVHKRREPRKKAPSEADSDSMPLQRVGLTTR